MVYTMKRSVVYVIFASHNPEIVAMLYISIRFLRFHHSDAVVKIVTDQPTLENYIDNDPAFQGLVDEKLVLEHLYGSDDVMMSRHAKTSLAQLIREPFIYIDVDAVVVSPISELFEMVTEFAACQDGNCQPADFEFPEFEISCFRKMSWSIPNGPYFNGGVIIVGSSDRVRNFFARWHGLWLQSSKAGIFKDQPPLNIALRDTEIEFSLLEPRYNFLLSMYVTAAHNPSIVHYSTVRFFERNDTVFHRLVRSIIDKNDLCENEIQNICSSRYFWNDRQSIRRIISAQRWEMLPSALIQKFKTIAQIRS